MNEEYEADSDAAPSWKGTIAILVLLGAAVLFIDTCWPPEPARADERGDAGAVSAAVCSIDTDDKLHLPYGPEPCIRALLEQVRQRNADLFQVRAARRESIGKRATCETQTEEISRLRTQLRLRTAELIVTRGQLSAALRRSQR